MSKCCGNKNAVVKAADPCQPPEPTCGAGDGTDGEFGPLVWFRDMVDNCLAYAKAEQAAGKHVVGIMCEYTPRELIMAAGGIPVCLCGGFEEMILPAEEFLPANLCPLIKSTYGFSVEKSNPFMEMSELLVGETTCDGKKKMYELLSESHDMHVLELPQKGDDADAFELWLKSLHKLKDDLERRFGTTVTDAGLREAIGAMNAERGRRRELAALMRADTPPLTGRELLDMKSIISCMPADAEQYDTAITGLSHRMPAPPAADGVRVLLTGVPIPHGAERVLDIIESNGGLVVCQENCTGLKPQVEDVDVTADDPMRAIAEKYFHLPCSVMTPNTGRMDLLKELVRDYRVECVIELVWQACITYDVESYHVRKLVKDELGLPYLRIETDYSPSDAARIATRVQAMSETVEGRP
jgi:benzoyl-CoA reductase/2-hydroxyglutaryl-CoA dehydratase subunit BcrC/BadD/HgdB